MKATGLMLGNLLEYKCVNDLLLKRWPLIGDWTEKRIDVYDIENISGLCTYHDWDYRPIPLTEEWLIRFGFEKWQTDDGVHNDYFIHKDFFPESFVFYLPYHSLNIYVGGVTVEYVHQMQNLFFALTGKEL